MGTDLKLSKRLSAIADMVNTGTEYADVGKYFLCDVGTDHAHIPIRLILDGTISGAIAMDVIEGPLEKARGNIELYGVQDRIRLRLSDGLDAYTPGEAQGLVIAGMGGRIMKKILLREPFKSCDFKELILQPQADPEFVRGAVRRLGLYPDREEIIFEDGKYYPVIHAVHKFTEGPDWEKVYGIAQDEQEAAFRQAVEDEFGPVLMRDRSEMLYRYLLWQKGVNDRIIRSLSFVKDAGRPALLEKKEQVSRKERMILAALGFFDR